MKCTSFVIAACAAFAMLAPATVRSAPVEDAALQAQLSSMISGYQGKVALFATDLRTGKTVAIDADAPVPTASVIKLAVLFDAVKHVQDGTARWNEKLKLTKTNQVDGSGVLTQFDTPLTLTLKDALTMMVIVSDNTATNLVIDRFGIPDIDKRVQWLGLKNTWLYKKVFMPPTGVVPADQPQFGLGKTTAREMAEIMRRLVTCDLNVPSTSPASPRDQKICDVATNMLKNQTDRDSIPRYLGGGVTVANKTGSLDAVRNDVGAVFLKDGGPIVISAFTHDNNDRSWTPDNAGHLLIGKMSAAIVNAWQESGH